MRIILYAENTTLSVKTILQGIHSHIPALEVITCTTVEELEQSLRKPLHNIAVAVLLPASRKDLTRLNTLHPLFDNTRILLILPDRTEETSALALNLKTSFISYADIEIDNIFSVLKHIYTK